MDDALHVQSYAFCMYVSLVTRQAVNYCKTDEGGAADEAYQTIALNLSEIRCIMRQFL